jgi:hypothetical protein
MVFKKPVPPDSETFRVPQSIGKPGWIVLTYENNIPVCVWITPQECFKLPFSCDERICNDTFLRVEKVGPHEFVVSDIWVYNSNCVFACSTFQQRYEWLKSWLNTFVFHIPGTTIKLIHKSEWNGKCRGHEVYTHDIGTSGYYTDEPGELVSIIKLNIPDCYEIKGGKGYLRVPDLALSQYLRTRGDDFKEMCIDNRDGSWSVVRR